MSAYLNVHLRQRAPHLVLPCTVAQLRAVVGNQALMDACAALHLCCCAVSALVQRMKLARRFVSLQVPPWLMEEP